MRNRNPKTYWWLAGVLAVGLCSCLLQLQAEGYHIRHPDALQYATMAREMVNTGRCATDLLLPNQVIGAKSIDISGLWPAQFQRVGYPLILSAAFAVIGSTDLAVHAVSIVFFLGMLAVVFAFGHQLWGLPAALVASGLAITHSNLAHEGIVGDLEMPYAFLGVLALYLAYRSRSILDVVGTALAIGAAYMIRPTALGLLVVAGLVLWPEKGKLRWKWLTLLLVVFVATAIAGHLTEAALTPAPLAPDAPHSNKWAQFLLYSTEAYPDHEVGRGLRLVTMDEVFRYKRDIAEKIIRGLRQAYYDTGQWVFTYIIVFAVIGAVNGIRISRRRDQLAITVLALYLAALAVPVICYHAGFHRYMVVATVCLLPLAGVGLVALIKLTWQRWGTIQATLISLFLAGCVLYPRTVNVAEQFVIPNTSVAQLAAQWIGDSTQPDDIILTDEVDRLTAWYGPRRVLRLPDTVEKTLDICQRVHPVDAIAVAAQPRFFQLPKDLPPEQWFPGFELTQTFTVSNEVDRRQFHLFEAVNESH